METTYKNVIEEYRMFSDSGDPWGSAMAFYFDIVGEMYHRGLQIPEKWEYSPGLGSRDEESFFFDLLEGVPDDCLCRLGVLFNRYTRFLERNFMSY